ncbi:uncharacterized protein LACBIDRAFT_306539 [Laccaria bicolor S238N-H82]|uniref:Predicted protein n=1 Tax=Laccaria bicolor (strain S238N-H82 / ATCC MYA-4686) TaxID=486041 RepID=B0DN96_LACBS|nr:uncharacterized protein LACBIDRAFT_306539 [Laccaria bicolor S238N-H82]EDR03899.1 predicted protein [Laccaria bicolor S238N-H82]|eukprot:XP_001885467.1 predicted protein [Laccaria bicolor S238N-H82]
MGVHQGAHDAEHSPTGLAIHRLSGKSRWMEWGERRGLRGLHAHLRAAYRKGESTSTELPTPIRLLVLNWSSPVTIRRICADSIQFRGANHQTLHADLSTYNMGVHQDDGRTRS